MRVRFRSLPALIHPLVEHAVRARIKAMLWRQGVLRPADHDIVESAQRDWRVGLDVMSDGRSFVLGRQPTGVDVIVLASLATTMLSPIRDELRSQPTCPAYVDRLRTRFFPELTITPSQRTAAHAVQRIIKLAACARVLSGHGRP